MQFCHLTGEHITQFFLQTFGRNHNHTSTNIRAFQFNQEKKTSTKSACHDTPSQLALIFPPPPPNELLPNMDQVLIEHRFCGTKAKGRRRPKARVTAFIQKKKKKRRRVARPSLCFVTPVSMGCPLWKPGSLSSPLGHGNVSPALLSGGGG